MYLNFRKLPYGFASRYTTPTGELVGCAQFPSTSGVTRVEGSGFRVQGFRGLGFRDQCFGFQVSEGSRCSKKGTGNYSRDTYLKQPRQVDPLIPKFPKC